MGSEGDHTDGTGLGATGADGARPAIQVTIVLCVAPRSTRQWTLELAPGATLADALRATGAPECLAASGAPAQTGTGAAPAVGIWGRQAAPDARLKHLDRVEIYRPLKVDPKLARRERFARQGARGAGLFARQRPGGKPGY